MERTNPMDKVLFNYSAYEQLCSTLGNAVKKGDVDAEEDCSSVKKAFNSFSDYVHNVDMMETQIKLAYARLDGNELRESVARYDTIRKAYHEKAIANCSLVNSIARFYEAGKVFLGDPGNRYDVADFCLDFTVQVFQNRKI